MAGPAFRKTAAGSDELRARRLRLDPRTRSVLILVNGTLDAEGLCARLGFDLRPVLQRLCDARLIEPVPDAAAGAAPAPPPPAPDPLLPRDLEAARARAGLVLVQTFGPDAPRIGAPLWAARTAEDFAAGLAALRDAMAAHTGRRHAEQVLRRIANSP